MTNAQISHGPKNSITAIMLFLHGALQLFETFPNATCLDLRSRYLLEGCGYQVSSSLEKAATVNNAPLEPTEAPLQLHLPHLETRQSNDSDKLQRLPCVQHQQQTGTGSIITIIKKSKYVSKRISKAQLKADLRCTLVLLVK